MQITPRRTALLAAAVFTALFLSVSQASAATFLSVQVGGPPPEPRHDYERWAPPSRDAIWIEGHNEWIHGHWVWIGGYYEYPPHRGAHWVPGHYRDGYWRPGHWE